MNRTTQRFVHSSLALILLLAIAGCSGREPSYPEQSNTTPTALDITDLKEILSTLDASNATLTYYNGENEETYPANAAIRAEKYITELQNYDMWEICQPPEHWSSNGDCHYSFNGDGVSLTAYRNGFEGVRPLHVTTSIGDNWFRLADSTLAQTDSTQQLSWMLCDTFGNWYNEAQAATLNRSTGTPLAADELDEFEAFTSSQVSTYVEEWGRYVVSSTPISCFLPLYMTIRATWTQMLSSPTVQVRKNLGQRMRPNSSSCRKSWIGAMPAVTCWRSKKCLFPVTAYHEATLTRF